ncbi:phage tail protein [Longispora sp. K20-0274]|uniref:phage tail protein n=1 Tax=Longispora sp. K20-0274 TaxID=3088255 RepID=UPI00399B16D7
MTAPIPDRLVQSFRFGVTLSASGGGRSPTPLGNGAFAECSGLTLDADVRELLEGGFNDGVVRRVGRVKLQPLVLKRGMIVSSTDGYADTSFWSWLTAMVRGDLPVPRCDGHVLVQGLNDKDIVAHWSFVRGLPVKVTGPTLNARTGEVAIEELHIAHEGLLLEDRP